MGAKPTNLFTLIILEGIILALISFVVGIVLSHIALWFMAGNMSESYKYSFSSWSFGKRELYLLLFSLAIGFCASIIPAWRAYRTDILDSHIASQDGVVKERRSVSFHAPHRSVAMYIVVKTQTPLLVRTHKIISIPTHASSAYMLSLRRHAFLLRKKALSLIQLKLK